MYKVALEHMTPEQAETLINYFARQSKSWKEFSSCVVWNSYLDCVMFAYAGMRIGIEKDGHAHS